MPTTQIPKYTLTRRRDRGTWEVSWYVNGKRKRMTVGKIKEMPKYAATQKAEHLFNNAIYGKEPLQVNKRGVDDFFERYFEWARNVQQKAKKTIEIEKNAVRHFLSVVPINQLDDIQAEQIERCIRTMKKQYSPTTINIMIRVWRMLSNRAIKWGMANNNPFREFKPIKTPEKHISFCTSDEVDKFLVEAQKLDTKLGDGRGDNAKYFKIELVIGLGFYAGLRKQEIAHACWDWFDFEKETITVKNTNDFSTKSRKNRILPMNERLKQILEKYHDGKNSGYIFGKPWDFRKRFEYLCRQTELEWVTPHIMRHTFGSLLAQKGVSLYKIAKWMGHTSHKVTELYAHLQDQDEEINKL